MTIAASPDMLLEVCVCVYVRVCVSMFVCITAEDAASPDILLEVAKP